MGVAPLTQGQAKATGGRTDPWEQLPKWALDPLPTSGGSTGEPSSPYSPSSPLWQEPTLPHPTMTSDHTAQF